MGKKGKVPPRNHEQAGEPREPPEQAIRWYETSVTVVSERRPVRLRQYYCGLMGHPFSRQFKKDTYVFVARDPVHAVVVHNKGLAHNKDTLAIAPHWRLLVATGPFASPTQVLAFANEWVNGTRGSHSKRRRASELAVRYGVQCYAADAPPPPNGVIDYLREHAPSSRYAEACERLLENPKAAAAAATDNLSVVVPPTPMRNKEGNRVYTCIH